MKRIVFCDFDGSITVEETFVAVEKQFAPALTARLLPYLDEYQKPYIPWNDFLQVRDYLARLWK